MDDESKDTLLSLNAHRSFADILYNNSSYLSNAADRFPDGVSPSQTIGNNSDATGDGRKEKMETPGYRGGQERISKTKKHTKENTRQGK